MGNRKEEISEAIKNNVKKLKDKKLKEKKSTIEKAQKRLSRTIPSRANIIKTYREPKQKHSSNRGINKLPTIHEEKNGEIEENSDIYSSHIKTRKIRLNYIELIS